MKIYEKKQKNYGIALLRVLLSFMVVIDHCYNKRKKKVFMHILYYHIPTFFVLSFYFTYHTFATYNISKIKLRFERIVIPYFVWSVICWLLFNIYYYKFKRKCPHKIYDLFSGLLNGHSLNLTFWFQVILVLTSLIMAIFVLFFREKYLLILNFWLAFSYILQYSGLNYNFFLIHYDSHYSATYSRFFNTFPNSICGFFLAAYNIPSKLKFYKNKIIIISLIILAFISKYQFDKCLFINKYGGIRLNFASICLFFIFYYLPCDKIKNKILVNFLNIITDYTAGIYFLHYIIKSGYIIRFFLDKKKLRTVSGSIYIYLISFIISFFIDKSCGNTKLKHLVK